MSRKILSHALGMASVFTSVYAAGLLHNGSNEWFLIVWLVSLILLALSAITAS